MQSANPQTITDAKFAGNGKILEPKGHGEDLPLGFIEREIRKISSLQSQEKDPETSKRLYACRQALSWAIDPSGFKSPCDWATGTPAN